MPEEYPPITVDMYFDAKAILPEVLPPQDDPYVTHFQDMAIHWKPVYADRPFKNPLRSGEDPTYRVVSWTCLHPLVAESVFTQAQEPQKE